MPYVLTENKNIKIGTGGHPLWYDKDKEESTAYEVDGPGANAKITAITVESNERRKKLGEAQTVIEGFGDLDPVAARKAIQDVSGMSDKGKADLEKQRDSINATWEAKEKTWTDKETGLNSQLFDATVGTKFATSKVVAGTVLPPDVAKATFGHHFNQDGSANDAAGNVINSMSKPGHPAGFDEALTIIINAREDKDSILKASDANGGDGHKGGGGDSGDKDLSSLGNIKAGLKARGI